MTWPPGLNTLGPSIPSRVPSRTTCPAVANRPGATGRENGKKGGRPKGTKLPKTLEKEAARALLRELVCLELGPLVEAQIRAALGIRHFVLREPDGKFKRVTNPAAIQTLMKLLAFSLTGAFLWVVVATREPAVIDWVGLSCMASGMTCPP